jgi:hypothetical protein
MENASIVTTTVLPDREAVRAVWAPFWAEDRPVTLDVGDGWLPLLDDLARLFVQFGSEVRVTQVKEKFGLLNVYTAGGATPEALGAIRLAGAISNRTCEVCGNPGRTGDRRGWSSVRCAVDAPEGWEPYDPATDG